MAKSAMQLTRQAMSMFENADRQGRELTSKEREDASAILDEARAQKDVEAQLRHLEYGDGAVPWERGIDGAVQGHAAQGGGELYPIGVDWAATASAVQGPTRPRYKTLGEAGWVGPPVAGGPLSRTRPDPCPWPRGTALVPTAASDTSRSSRSIDAMDDLDAQGTYRHPEPGCMPEGRMVGGVRASR